MKLFANNVVHLDTFVNTFDTFVNFIPISFTKCVLNTILFQRQVNGSFIVQKCSWIEQKVRLICQKTFFLSFFGFSVVFEINSRKKLLLYLQQRLPHTDLTRLEVVFEFAKQLYAKKPYAKSCIKSQLKFQFFAYFGLILQFVFRDRKSLDKSLLDNNFFLVEQFSNILIHEVYPKFEKNCRKVLKIGNFGHFRVHLVLPKEVQECLQIHIARS